MSRLLNIVLAILLLASLSYAKEPEQKQAPAFASPRDDGQPISPESAAYLEGMRKDRVPFGTNGFDVPTLRGIMGGRREPSIEGVKLIKKEFDGIPAEWVVAKDADPDVRLLYIHGGGWVSGCGAYYLRMAAQISNAAKCAVLLPDYRLAPEHPFPAGLEDCVLAYECMLMYGPDGTRPAKAAFVAGDSAGGNLTFATVLAIKKEKLQMPNGAIPISAATDFTLQSDSLKTAYDPIISSKTMPIFREHYVGKADPKDPLISPVFGDYHGICPLLIVAGEHEMLRDDSIRAAKKAEEDGVNVKLEIWPGMFHVFQSHEPLLPEGRESIEHMAKFMQSLIPKE